MNPFRGSHNVDHRADIYSLGVVFYEMLTGELPIGKFEPPSRKVQVDVRLDEVVLRALESEPQRRYQKASEVKTDVETISRQAVQAASGPASSDDFGSIDLVQAWRQWWAERSRWFAWTIQGFLMLLHIVSMCAFISFHSISTWNEQGRLQVTTTIGLSDFGFSPWFVAETRPDARTYFRWAMRINSSWLCLLIGIVAYAILWRIEKAISPDAGKPGWWRTRRAWCVGSPTGVSIFWLVLTVAVVGFAMWSTAAHCTRAAPVWCPPVARTAQTLPSRTLRRQPGASR